MNTASENICYREKLWYKKYRYRVVIVLPRGSRFYRPSKTLLKSLLENDAKVLESFLSGKQKIMFDKNPNMYKEYGQWLNKHKDADYFCRSESYRTSFFSNDLNILYELKTISPGLFSLTTAEVAVKNLTIKVFKTKPKHKFRIYFKSQRVRTDEEKAFSEFLFEHKDKLFPSPALQAHLIANNSWKWRWLSSSYFIDYDIESIESWLFIKWGNLFGTAYKLLHSAEYQALKDQPQDTTAEVIKE